MDLFAGIFGFILLTLGVGVTYQWGIKPDRERKKHRAEQMRRSSAGCILKSFAEAQPCGAGRLQTARNGAEVLAP
jgi:hypothetical protein